MSAGELTAATAAIDDEDLYPSEDGEPLSETNVHFFTIFAIHQAIWDLFADRQDEVSVYSNLMWYWEQDNSAARRAPDLIVLFGVPYVHLRSSYLAWRHGNTVPGVVIETASRRQRSLLLGDLRDDYEQQGVQEYFVFDWGNITMNEPLLGFRLDRGRYQPIPVNADGTLTSLMMGVKLRPEGDRLRLVDVQTGAPIPTRDEKAAAVRRVSAHQAEQLAAKDEQLATKAEQLAAKDQALAAKDAELSALREMLKRPGQNPGPDAGGAK